MNERSWIRNGGSAIGGDDASGGRRRGRFRLGPGPRARDGFAVSFRWCGLALGFLFADDVSRHRRERSLG